MALPRTCLCGQAADKKFLHLAFDQGQGRCCPGISRIWQSINKKKEAAARIVLVNDIFRAMTRQVQYMAIHCTPKMKELNLCTNT